MKVLVAGLGSMGKRRVRNLQALGVTDIVGYDPRPDRREEAASLYGISTVDGWDAAAALPVDAWIVSTPPDTHLDYAFQAVERRRSFFCEVGVPDLRVHRLVKELEATGVVGAPSCTMRYFPGPRLAKEVLSSGRIGRPRSFTYHFGHYLPDWHSWESYKDFYVSKRETGACREILCFDLIWLTDLLGTVADTTGLRGRVGGLDADIDDVYDAVLRFRDGTIGSVMIEVVARPPIRRLWLCGSEGTFEWDHASNSARVWTVAAGAWEAVTLDRGDVKAGYIYAEEPYIAEMRDFLSAVRGETVWDHSFAKEAAVMELALRIEENSTGKDSDVVG